jgi:hypothetical protein
MMRGERVDCIQSSGQGEEWQKDDERRTSFSVFKNRIL